MPLPQQAQWTVPFYSPEKVSEHAENTRSLDRAVNQIPIFPKLSWNVLYADDDGSGSGGTNIAFSSAVYASVPLYETHTYGLIGPKTFRKYFDWTDIEVIVSHSLYGASNAVSVQFGVSFNGTSYPVDVNFVNWVGTARHCHSSNMALFRGGTNVWPKFTQGVYTVTPTYKVNLGVGDVRSDANDQFAMTVQEVLPEPTNVGI